MSTDNSTEQPGKGAGRPTREQIAKALYPMHPDAGQTYESIMQRCECMADAVLALFGKAERPAGDNDAVKVARAALASFVDAWEQVVAQQAVPPPGAPGAPEPTGTRCAHLGTLMEVHHYPPGDRQRCQCGKFNTDRASPVAPAPE